MKRINVYVSSTTSLQSSTLLSFLSNWEDKGFTWDIIFISDYLKKHKHLKDKKYLELLYKLPSTENG